MLPKGPGLRDTPAVQIERILREYASECYAVGRGESMYYLVEDLPRIAHAATQEILAVRPQGMTDRWLTGFGIPNLIPTLPSSSPKAPVPIEHLESDKRQEGPLVVGQTNRVSTKRGARSVVAILPVLTVVAAFGLTILLAVASL